MNLKQLLTNIKDKVFNKPKDIEKESEAPPTEISVQKARIPWHLTEEQKMIIIGYIASYMTPSEIIEICKEKHAINISFQQITKYKEADKWKPIIKKLREEYLADLPAVAGSHKRVRMERVERIYERAIKKNDLKNQLASVEHQRKEIEGDRSGSLHLTLNQFSNMSDEELYEQRKRVLDQVKKLEPKKEIIDVEKVSEESNSSSA